MDKKKLENLNLVDDFLFGTLVSHPEFGEPFVKEILKTIFGRSFGRLTVVPQKVYYGTDTDMHGARLDVYLEEDAEDPFQDAATVYDMEPDNNNDKRALRSLPRRVRFYHAMIDGNSLKSGEDYNRLKNVFVILIMTYDPFGANRMVYTAQQMIKEDPSLPYEDGAQTIFLYTRGKEGNPPEALRELLRYMEHSIRENVTNDNLKRIDQMVNLVKRDKEVSRNYMKIFEREAMLVQQGIEQEKKNTEREKQRADQERQRADQERLRAEKAERELQMLREQLSKLKNKD